MLPRISRVTGVRLYFIPLQTRMPLKFGSETLSSVTCARVALRITDQQGRQAEGWGETPLSVQWVWPSSSPYEERHTVLKRFCCRLASAWMAFEQAGHPLEIGHAFQEQVLRPLVPGQTGTAHSQLGQIEVGGATRESSPVLPLTPALSRRENIRQPFSDSTLMEREPRGPDDLPWLAGLVCNSPFDIALHDAFGKLVERPTYLTYSADFLGSDLSCFLEPAPGTQVSFQRKHPADFLERHPPVQLRAWHLVGGLDLLEPGQLRGDEPRDGYPVVLTDWIERDGLKCLKIKLRGNDAEWDLQRLLHVGQLALARHVEWLSADFNCTVNEPAYVNQILDQLRTDHPEIFARLLYVEQPFPYDLERYRINVASVSARKPLFLDESAHDWRMIRLGRDLGWTGVALKTCKTQTEAVLSGCWAKAHGMSLMVQDLTNPMLAQIPHVQLAANIGTIMGVETNAMQFYPAASAPEAKVHPGLYQRRNGMVDLSSIHGFGFGYRLEEIRRELPEPAATVAG